MPSRHWGDAVATAVYLLNRMPSKVLNFKTPLQVISTHFSLPTVLMLPHRIFGWVAFVHFHKNQRTKLDPYTVCCLFLGYGLHKKGYRCYDPATNCVYITMDVTFLEFEPFYPSLVSNSDLQGETRSEELNWMMTLGSGAENVDAALQDVAPESERTRNNEVERSDEAENVEPEDGNESENDENTEFPQPLVPENSLFENIPKVNTPIAPSYTHVLDSAIAGYTLPFRHNRGKPPNRYSPDEEERRSKYPIANYVSTQSLSEPLKTFTQTISSCHIPS